MKNTNRIWFTSIKIHEIYAWALSHLVCFVYLEGLYTKIFPRLIGFNMAICSNDLSSFVLIQYPKEIFKNPFNYLFHYSHFFSNILQCFRKFRCCGIFRYSSVFRCSRVTVFWRVPVFRCSFFPVFCCSNVLVFLLLDMYIPRWLIDSRVSKRVNCWIVLHRQNTDILASFLNKPDILREKIHGEEGKGAHQDKKTMILFIIQK